MKLLRIFLIYTLLLLAFTTSNLLFATPVNSLSEIFDGPPAYINRETDPINYVSIKTKRLSSARIVWFNFSLAYEMGIDIPKEGMTPEFEEKLLDHLGYMIPKKDDTPGTFTEQEKIFMADRYGGDGLEGNLGSGRAASANKIQIKGIGVTSLVGPKAKFHHAHGGASMNESIQEAIWGEINHRELPFGSNRVLAIIDSGTFTAWEDGSKEARALIVRQDPLRPAHYILNENSSATFSEEQRLSKMIKRLPDALPHKSDVLGLSDQEKILNGLDEFIDRLAKQFAATNARLIYHGADSSSNIDLTGKFLDFGTETSLSGYGKAGILLDVTHFQEEIFDHVRFTLNGLLSSISLIMGNAANNFLPKIETIFEITKNKFETYQSREFLYLTGIPKNIVNKLLQEHTDTMELGKMLVSLAYEGTDFVNVDKVMPNKMGKNDLEKILIQSATLKTLTTESLSQKLAEDLPEENARAFAELYILFYKRALKKAYEDGINEDAFRTLISKRTSRINKKRVELYRSNLANANNSMVERYKNTQNRSLIWDYINEKIQSQTRTYKDEKPYVAIIGEWADDLYGAKSRLLYDARKGGYYIEQIMEIRNNKINYYGNLLTKSQILESKMYYSLNNWSSHEEAQIKFENNKAVFRMSVEENHQNINFYLSHNGQKIGKNIELNFKSDRPLDNCFDLIRLFFRQ